jgi:hypothetical protein
MHFKKRLPGEIGVPLVKETIRQNGELIENEDYASAGLRSLQPDHIPWSMPENQIRKKAHTRNNPQERPQAIGYLTLRIFFTWFTT